MALNEQQKTQLRNTWDLLYVREKRGRVGADLFISLFREHPKYRQQFRSFKDDHDLAALAETAKLKAHGFRVVATINNLIETLDDPALFVEQLKNMARTHHLHGVTRDSFGDMAPILLATFGNHIGGKFTPKAREAWVAAYNFIVDTLVAEYVVIGRESGTE
ncbi:globin-like isoform X2 [Amphiura filiformis]|uniref:globin-like isoform X1 n=1 Tax=Amphiura filiformis TaxID=82378 RepID=UPI003B222664